MNVAGPDRTAQIVAWEAMSLALARSRGARPVSAGEYVQAFCEELRRLVEILPPERHGDLGQAFDHFFEGCCFLLAHDPDDGDAGAPKHARLYVGEAHIHLLAALQAVRGDEDRAFERLPHVEQDSAGRAREALDTGTGGPRHDLVIAVWAPDADLPRSVGGHAAEGTSLAPRAPGSSADVGGHPDALESGAGGELHDEERGR